MNTEAIQGWIQFLAAGAVIAGLVLVVYELRQNREATMSQLTSEAYLVLSEFHNNIAGEEPSEVLAQACFDPSNLTDADLFRLENIYNANLLALCARLVVTSLDLPNGQYRANRE